MKQLTLAHSFANTGRTDQKKLVQSSIHLNPERYWQVALTYNTKQMLHFTFSERGSEVQHKTNVVFYILYTNTLKQATKSESVTVTESTAHLFLVTI
jgi:hypothetical protein